MRPLSFALVALASLAIIPSGCIRWGLGEARGYEAARGQISARMQHASASAIADVIGLFREDFESVNAEAAAALEAIGCELEAIQLRAADDYTLATIRAADHGREPQAPPVLGSAADDRQVQAYAGHSHARGVARTRRAEISAAAGEAAADLAARVITRTIPAPVQWTFWLSLIGGMFTLFVGLVTKVWRWARRERRVADDAHDHIADLIAAARQRGASPEKLAAIAHGHPYARARHVERQLAGTAD